MSAEHLLGSYESLRDALAEAYALPVGSAPREACIERLVDEIARVEALLTRGGVDLPGARPRPAPAGRAGQPPA